MWIAGEVEIRRNMNPATLALVPSDIGCGILGLNRQPFTIAIEGEEVAKSCSEVKRADRGA